MTAFTPLIRKTGRRWPTAAQWKWRARAFWRRWLPRGSTLALFFSVFAAVFIVGLPATVYWPKLAALISNREASVAHSPSQAPADLPPRLFRVIDGDTVRYQGRSYRLVGFDTPESGTNARCAREQSLAARATSRLRQLVASGGLQFTALACACPVGTEGTRRCNYGRGCGALTANGRDVGSVLISEGLARPYRCGRTSCPPRGSWC
jgi:endonuclease YncB( thermonuclease family)